MIASLAFEGSSDGGHEGAVSPQAREVREAGPDEAYLDHQAPLVPQQEGGADRAGRAEEP